MSERVHLWLIVSWWLTSKIPQNRQGPHRRTPGSFYWVAARPLDSKKPHGPLCYRVDGPGIREQETISALRALSQKCGLVYWFECYSTVDGKSLPRFVLVFLPFLIRKCVAPTGRFQWGQSIKIGLINGERSIGSTSRRSCYSALTRILGNAALTDCVTCINASSFFMFHRTFSSLHIHRVWKHLSAWSVWLATRQCAGRGFREPKQTQRYHTNMTSGVRNGEKQQVQGFGNATTFFPKLFSCAPTCQNLSDGYWAGCSEYRENSMCFQKK